VIIFHSRVTVEYHHLQELWRLWRYVLRNVGSNQNYTFQSPRNPSIIDTTVKASQKTAFFDHKINSVNVLCYECLSHVMRFYIYSVWQPYWLHNGLQRFLISQSSGILWKPQCFGNLYSISVIVK
jgi:hypothetical protein